jgi:hypothetical protein
VRVKMRKQWLAHGEHPKHIRHSHSGNKYDLKMRLQNRCVNGGTPGLGLCGLLCAAGCLTASLTSFCLLHSSSLVLPHCDNQKCLQAFPDMPWSQNHYQQRTKKTTGWGQGAMSQAQLWLAVMLGPPGSFLTSLGLLSYLEVTPTLPLYRLQQESNRRQNTEGSTKSGQPCGPPSHLTSLIHILPSQEPQLLEC